MWYFTLRVIVVAVHSCILRSRISHATPFRTAFINSPSVAMSYFLKTKLSDDNYCLKDFKEMKMNQREDLCRKMLINSVSFSLGSDSTDHIEANYFSEKIRETFTKYDADTIFLPDLYFTFEDSEFTQGIPAHICVIEETGTQWAIGIVNHQDILLLFHKPFNSEHFQISGLLESMPVMSSQAEVKYLEKRYLAVKTVHGESAELIVENKKDKTTFSRLHPHDKFRLCALADLALTNLEKENSVQMNVVNIDENMRVGKVLTNAFNSIFANLVPCAINEGIQNPRFFVTNDPSSMDSAFLVKPVRKNLEPMKNEKIVGYKIALYLENITVLKTSSRQF